MSQTGLIFDMDGVLVDVAASYRMAIRTTAEDFLEEKISDEEIQIWKDRGGYNDDWILTAAIISSRGRDVPFDQVVERFQHFYIGQNFDGLIANEKWLLDKMMLAELSENGATAIVTGRPREEAVYTLDRQEVMRYFQTIITADDIPENKKKPHPYGLSRALRYLGVEKAFYFGDSVDDMLAARGAGIVPVAVMDSGISNPRRRQRFIGCGARIIIPHINHIMEVINENG